jgi:hypothetical protein
MENCGDPHGSTNPGRAQDEQVAAHLGDLLPDRLGGTAAERDHGDHRRHADDDADHGEEGTCQVAADLAQRDQQGVEEHGE